MRRLAILASAALLGGCASDPLGYLGGSGSRSGDILQSLGWGLLLISIAVVIIIVGLILEGIRRSRRRAAASAADAVSANGGISAIYWGVGLSVPVLIAMAVWTFVSVRALATPNKAPGLTVTVTGHRWWWDIEYQSAIPYGTLRTANELVIPVGVPVRLNLQSADVIHDFWVPKLGPKTDMIPGRTNQSWIEADRAGVYRGQCAEFCGAEHGRMGFTVRAVAIADFDAWLARQLQPAKTNSPVQMLFEAKCGACHEVRGTAADGIYGPDLTHIGSRSTLAAALMPNTRHNLSLWLGNTQGLKPGANMPQVNLTPVERQELAGWLESLK